jgi:hypothetical protein
MNALQKFYHKAENYVLSRMPDSRVMIEAALRRGDNSISGQLNYQAKDIKAQTVKIWKQAVAAATDPEEPSWLELSALYENLMLDNHLASVIDSRILYVQRSPFRLVDEKGKENPELSWLLERPWMEDLIRLVLSSRFGGRKLIELFDTTPEGELADVTEIPQTHFNAKKGIITKEPGDSTGWSYREGVFTDYYVQVGKDYDLGMLEKLATIVLAKKMGLGSWLDYIEKFGIPPIFITTDREDDGRLKQLFDAAQNFRSNHFMVGRGAEKFEIGNTGGVDAYNTFDKLIDRANNEISKRVLGGSGIADEKSFVGSAEIQFRLAKDRYESDKLFFKYIFNAHIKPRLVKLSPVYAPLANHYFEWDNSESLSQKELIETIVKLGAQYDIDPEYITQATGIPVLGIRKQFDGFGEDNAGKKPR